MTNIEFTLSGEKLLLLPQKAIYWPAQQMLLIADLHLGKSTHFRNNGIAVPQKAEQKNWLLLHQLFKKYQPKRVLFLGDLFHSTQNKEWTVFSELIAAYPKINFKLVLGNHDILNEREYLKLGFELHKELKVKPFLFTHEPLEETEQYYNLAGHIHPGIVLKGRGKQLHRLPCFYFGKQGGILPAFGVFTGLFKIEPKERDQVFVIAGNEVVGI